MQSLGVECDHPGVSQPTCRKGCESKRQPDVSEAGECNYCGVRKQKSAGREEVAKYAHRQTAKTLQKNCTSPQRKKANGGLGKLDCMPK